MNSPKNFYVGLIYPLAIQNLEFFLSFVALWHNTDEPQPKRLTGENRANRANREGNDWEILFSFLISVYSVFSVLKNLCFFAHISLVRD
jgi:hypothetical protein